MKKILVFLSFIFIATANAEPFTVGNKVIEIPTPKGFVRITPQMDAVYRLSRELVAALPDLEVLAYYIPEADVPIAMSGKIPEMKHIFYVSANKKLKNSTTNSKDFDYVAQVASQQIKQSLILTKEKIQDMTDKTSTSVSREFNVDMKLKYLDTIPLEMHYKTANAFACSAYSKYKIIVNNQEDEFIQSTTTTMVNASGKIIYLYCFAPQEELEWTRSNSIVWSEMILKNNLAPPEKSSIKTTESLWQTLWNGCKKLGYWIFSFILVMKGLFFIIFLVIPLLIFIIIEITKSIINKFKK